MPEFDLVVTWREPVRKNVHRLHERSRRVTADRMKDARAMFPTTFPEYNLADASYTCRVEHVIPETPGSRPEVVTVRVALADNTVEGWSVLIEEVKRRDPAGWVEIEDRNHVRFILNQQEDDSAFFEELLKRGVIARFRIDF